MAIDLEKLIDKTVTQLGYELVDLEIINHGQLLRVFIDKLDSVNIDDCVSVSNQLNHVLSVEEEISYDRLEVSSPGVDRVIKKLEDYERFKEERVKIKTRMPILERRNFSGILKGVKGNLILLESENSLIEIDFEQIDKARLDPKL
ncbi:MAG: ribosome maturation factor RimP [Methylophilales bacterium]|nr:ribosome maturation factor RimP [Pseudomonadota bacterium]NQW35036.1 ribosome maturation factor RimP [Methylophilales bacterium]HCK03467.1 ribosome maturation factor RimP [Methylophilaceae bacterium]